MSGSMVATCGYTYPVIRFFQRQTDQQLIVGVVFRQENSFIVCRTCHF